MASVLEEANAELDAGRAEQAAEIARRGLDQEWRADLAHTRGVALFRQGEFDLAEQVFARVTTDNPGDAIAVYYRGLCCERQQRTGEALAHYRQAQELAPEMTEAADKVRALERSSGEAATADAEDFRADSFRGEPSQMADFDLPGSEEGIADYQRRQTKKVNADIWANWYGKPRSARVFNIVMMSVAGLIALGVIGAFAYSFLYAGPPENFGETTSEDVPAAEEIQ